jgi:hypothetical protein
VVAPGIFLKEAVGCPAEVPCFLQGTFRLFLGIRHFIYTHAGWPPICCPHRPQALSCVSPTHGRHGIAGSCPTWRSLHQTASDAVVADTLSRPLEEPPWPGSDLCNSITNRVSGCSPAGRQAELLFHPHFLAWHLVR